MRKKRTPGHENHERWLVSYADFITLMFAFFVVMFAASQEDKGKAKAVGDSVRKALEEGHMIAAFANILGGHRDDKGKGNAQLHGPGGDHRVTSDVPLDGKYVELLPALELLSGQLEEEVRQGRMKVSMEPRGLVVSFREAAFFPSGADEIPVDTHPTIAKVAEVIVQLPNPVRLEGHTDSVPLRGGGRFHSNWELSAARSIAMMELLVGNSVPRERLSIAGYAENAPSESNDTPEGRKRNRRVDIVILNKTGIRAEPTAASRGVAASPVTGAPGMAKH